MIVHAVAGAFIESTSVREEMPATRFIVVQAHHLVTDRTLGVKRVKPPPSDEFDEF